MSYPSFTFLMFILILVFFYFVIIPKKFRKYILLIANIIFYSFSDVKYFFFLFFSIITTFSGAILISERKNEKHKRNILILIVTINIGLLLFTKFFNFGIQSFARVFSLNEIPSFRVLVPLGISFYTLQAVSYIIDIYKGKYQVEKNIINYTVFMTFFPTIIQGPITRYNKMLEQFENINRKIRYIEIREGIQLILYGLFKKLVIADRAGILVNQVFNNHNSFHGVVIVLATILYSVQLYTDFSGCVEICRGVSKCLGINLQRNFNYPYFATSIKDFWGRWHISLSNWFRDYIYIPLGGNRRGKNIKNLNILTVYVVSGIWHGVGLQFMLWGMMHAFYQIFGDLSFNYRKKFYDKFHININSSYIKFIKILSTFTLVSLAWLIFRASSVSTAVEMLLSIPKSFLDYRLIYTCNLDKLDFYVLIISIILLFSFEFLQRKKQIVRIMDNYSFTIRNIIFFILFFIVLIFGIYGSGFDESKFIYMQF